MKRNISSLFVLLLLVSCQEGLLNRDDSSLSSPEDYICNLDYYQTKAETGIIDEPFVFLTETDFYKWSHIDGLEKRFKACDIPDSQLRMMTTAALVNSILHYPLNYLIFAYDDPFQAIDLIMEHSSLHKELVRRQDAAKVILNSFQGTVVSFEETAVSKDYTTLSYIDEMFLEYFIASDSIKGFSSQDNQQDLKKIVERKLEERAKDESYSLNSLEPLIRINKKKNLEIKYSYTLEYQVPLRSSVIHTFFGKSLNGDSNSEYSSSEITAITNYYVSNYPDASLISPASNLYNCHSYAWHNSSTTNNVWINAYYQGAFQLERYWIDDLYFSCNESSAEKVHYYLSDHSAIILSTGNYISKWGSGPLMEHAPNYGPYANMSYRNYYYIRTNPLDVISITGNTVIYPNEPNNYMRGTLVHGTLNYAWSVNYWNDSTTPYNLQQLVPDEYQLTCYDYGVFTIRVDGYYNGNNVAYGELDVNCIPEGF